MRTLDQAELKELLIKCWMTHDGAWFHSCLREFGIAAANRLNKAAIASLSRIELARITRALDIEIQEITTFASLQQVIDGMFSVVKGDFMDFEYGFPSENTMEWKIHRCFAHEGMKKMGASDGYQCGLLHRVGCWVEALGVEYEIDPSLDGCMMHEKGECHGKVRFRF